ncbi:MAG: MlaD family protein [Bacteroidota bacterium]|nr:MlaD family protein [Bacteroidota bacterium]
MKINQKTKVGLLATAAIVVLILGVNYLKGKSIFSDNVPLYAFYENVDGLQVSNPVLMYGTKVGQVDHIDIQPGNKYNVVVRFHVYGKVLIPKNSIAKIISSDLIGSKAIEIVKGDSRDYARNDDTLSGTVQESLTQSLEKVVAPVRTKVENLISSVDTIVSALNAIFTPATNENLRQSFTSISASMDNIQKASGKLDQFLGSETNRITAIMTDVHSIANNLKQNNANITRAINNFAAISDTLAAMNLKQTMDEVNTVMVRVSTILSKVENGEGSLGLLLNDKKLYENLQNASKSLDELVKDMKLNPNKYLHFSIVNF